MQKSMSPPVSLNTRLAEVQERQENLSEGNPLTGQTQWLKEEIKKTLAEKQYVSPVRTGSRSPPKDGNPLETPFTDICGVWHLESREDGSMEPVKYPLHINHNIRSGELTGTAVVSNQHFTLSGSYKHPRASFNLHWAIGAISCIHVEKVSPSTFIGTYINSYNGSKGVAKITMTAPVKLKGGLDVIDVVTGKNARLESKYDGDSTVLMGSWWLIDEDGVRRLRTEAEVAAKDMSASPVPVVAAAQIQAPPPSTLPTASSPTFSRRAPSMGNKEAELERQLAETNQKAKELTKLLEMERLRSRSCERPLLGRNYSPPKVPPAATRSYTLKSPRQSPPVSPKAESPSQRRLRIGLDSPPTSPRQVRPPPIGSIPPPASVSPNHLRSLSPNVDAMSSNIRSLPPAILSPEQLGFKPVATSPPNISPPVAAASDTYTRKQIAPISSPEPINRSSPSPVRAPISSIPSSVSSPAVVSASPALAAPVQTIAKQARETLDSPPPSYKADVPRRSEERCGSVSEPQRSTPPARPLSRHAPASPNAGSPPLFKTLERQNTPSTQLPSTVSPSPVSMRKQPPQSPEVAQPAFSVQEADTPDRQPELVSVDLFKDIEEEDVKKSIPEHEHAQEEFVTAAPVAHATTVPTPTLSPVAEAATPPVATLAVRQPQPVTPAAVEVPVEKPEEFSKIKLRNTENWGEYWDKSKGVLTYETYRGEVCASILDTDLVDAEAIAADLLKRKIWANAEKAGKHYCYHKTTKAVRNSMAVVVQENVTTAQKEYTERLQKAGFKLDAVVIDGVTHPSDVYFDVVLQEVTARPAVKKEKGSK
eukprot:TRINITY_DN26920_c0_g1_i1.p1 TRINITY_DN26920_c0_g1~~TRINITY_DN26920_c0_g1_i1.p1  ORF type:complete len:820 (+),score=162.95 TRINITY_DN26920_c0_g1_i1:40-2499(+)